MRLRWLKFLLIGMLALVVALLSLVFTVTRTETGAGLVLGIAQDQVDGLEIGGFEGSFHHGLVLQDVGLESADLSLRLDAVKLAVTTVWFPFILRIEQLEAQNLVYRFPTAEEESEPASLPDSLELPFPVDLKRIDISGIRVLNEENAEVFAARNFSASAQLERELHLRFLELLIEEGTVGAEGRVGLRKPFPVLLGLETDLEVPLEDDSEPLLLDLAAQARGTLEALDLEIDGTAVPPGFQAHTLKLDSRVTPTGMQARSFEVVGPDLHASGSSMVDWTDFRARFENVQLEIPGTDFKANAGLELDLQNEELEGQIAWQDFAWPLRDAAAEWASSWGDIRLSGSLDQWAVDGTLDAEAAGYPGGQMQIDVTGDRGGLQGRLVEMEALGGRLHGEGSYRWDDEGAFKVDVGLENVATDKLLPEYPAVLSGEVSAEGRLEPLSVTLDVQRLEGEALGQLLNAKGRVEVGDGYVRAEDFSIESGSSRLTLDGYPDQTNGLLFELNITELGDFLPDSRGAIGASGKLRLHENRPVLDLEAQARNLAWQDTSVSSMTVSGGSQDPDGIAHAFDLELTDTRVGGSLFEQVRAQLLMQPDRQSLDIMLESGSNRVASLLDGEFEHGWNSANPWRWTGQLARFDVLLNEVERISLQEPALVQASAQEALLEDACLLDTSGAVTCLEASWSLKSGSSLAARLEQLPLELLDEILGLQLQLSQQVSGEIRLSQAAGSKPSGAADFRITEGVVKFPDDPEPIMETGPGALAFALSEGRLTRGVLDIPITGQGVIDVDYSVPDVTQGLAAELAGTLLIDLADLDSLAVLVPRIDRASGSLRANLEMSGTVGQPYFSGKLNLQDGVFENRAIGLKLEDINLSGNLLGNGETLLTGGFRAAEGVGALEARVDLRNITQPQFELGISGEQLKLFNSDDLMVVVDPDLSVAFQPGSVTIGGELHVPSALIAPALIPEGTVSESEDLVIVAGRPAGEDDTETESPPLEILGDLKISLGDKVKLDVTVAKLDVNGAVEFDWQGPPIPVANGNFSVLGEVVAFGQRLDIAQGDISFPGVPADNPHLNIRAERQIYGNSEVRRAGLLVAGTLTRPVIEPYTDPMTNRDRAQTLLVTGSDFNMERGVGAVDIGTYIAPRIFVSYGVGVFDDQNVVSIRYDLGRGWGVKATSGERQTGVDISYTLEN